MLRVARKPDSLGGGYAWTLVAFGPVLGLSASLITSSHTSKIPTSAALWIGVGWAFGGRTGCYCECMIVRKAAADWRLPGAMPASRLPSIGRIATSSQIPYQKRPNMSLVEVVQTR